MASFVAQPVTDKLEIRPAPERLNIRDGALLTETHFELEQLYHRSQLARLALHLHGAGTIAGLDVSYEPTSGPDVEVKVRPGLAIDRLGRLVELQYESCLNLSRWLLQQDENAASRARVVAGLRDADDGIPQHLVTDVYLAYHACARAPEPALASGNADTIDGVQASRILETGLLSMVIRPQGDNREPSSLPATELTESPVPIDDLRNYKRLRSWDLVQPEEDPFRIQAGGDISEHVVAGQLQDGTEILLARLIIPVINDADQPVRFDDTVDLGEFPIDQSIRPYSYSSAEIALLAAGIRR